MSAVFEKASNEGIIDKANSAILATLVEVLSDKVQQVVVLSFKAVETYLDCCKKYSQITIKLDQHAFEKMLT